MQQFRECRRSDVLLGLALALFAGVALPASANLVVNGSFEDVPGAEWAFYGTTDLDQFTGWFGITAQDGDWFVGSAIDGGTKSGGVLQQVTVEPGRTYLYTGWVASWKRDAFAVDPLGRIGIDLTGGTDPEAETVLWSIGVFTLGTWQQLGLTFTATGDTSTIFLDMQQFDPTFNLTAVDNAVVEEITPGTISGFVYDADTNVLAGATVMAVPLGAADETDGGGAYSLALPEGTYEVTASLLGYESQSVNGVPVASGATVPLDFYLAESTCEGLVFDNGGFESGVAPPWAGYQWVGGVEGPAAWFGGITARSGERFYGWADHGSGGEGGLLQQVCATPGVEVELRGWSRIYWIGGTESNTMSRIGIDPTGGTNPRGDAIVWSDWDLQLTQGFSEWHELSVAATAVTPMVTLFLDIDSDNVGGDQWHIHCFDDVEFTELLPDTDGDGMDDQWEIDHGLNHMSPDGDDGANGDPDKDDSRNIDEYRMRTHPKNWHSAFRVTSLVQDSSVTLDWTAGITGPFRVFRGNDPALTDAIAVATGLDTPTYTDPAAGDSLAYRVALDVGFPPIAAAIADPQQIVEPGDPVTLDGSGSIGDVFAWTQTEGDPVILAGAGTSVATFTAPAISQSVERLAFTLSVNEGADTADAEVFVVSPVVGSTVLYARDYETESTGIAADYVGRPDDRTVTLLADGSGRSTNAARCDIVTIRKHGGAVDTGANGQAAMITALNDAGAADGYVLAGDVLFDPPGADEGDRTGIWGMADPDEGQSAVALLLRRQGGPRMTLRLAQYTMHAGGQADENTIVTKDPLGPDWSTFTQWYRLELILLRVPGTDSVICEGRAWNVEAGDPRPAAADVAGVVTLPAGQDQYLVGIYGYDDAGDGGWVDDFVVNDLE